MAASRIPLFRNILRALSPKGHGKKTAAVAPEPSEQAVEKPSALPEIRVDSLDVQSKRSDTASDGKGDLNQTLTSPEKHSQKPVAQLSNGSEPDVVGDESLALPVHDSPATDAPLFSAVTRAHRSLSSVAQGARYEAYARASREEKRLAAIAESSKRNACAESPRLELPHMDVSLDVALPPTPTDSEAEPVVETAETGEGSAKLEKHEQQNDKDNSESPVVNVAPTEKVMFSPESAEHQAKPSASNSQREDGDFKRYRTPISPASPPPANCDPALHFSTQCYSNGKPLFEPPPPGKRFR
ncbi:hypothetical protein Slin15195_G045670 [Septoria linicola]|uniref:Uncharacterized protein n=1 Tax=Septoria linicola TaxID=215465 RepID=A0A9Q9AQI2_9PEZI|nr:hypothetical protein Slin15195_G045670 [Septoria linicola]